MEREKKHINNEICAEINNRFVVCTMYQVDPLLDDVTRYLPKWGANCVLSRFNIIFAHNKIVVAIPRRA